MEDITQEHTGLVGRVCAIDLGKETLTACVRVPHDQRSAVIVGDIMDGDDPRMVEASRRAGLPQHPPDQQIPLLGHQAVGQQDLLDRHLAIEDLVAGSPHPAHPTLADRLDQPIPPTHQLTSSHRHDRNHNRTRSTTGAHRQEYPTARTPFQPLHSREQAMVQVSSGNSPFVN